MGKAALHIAGVTLARDFKERGIPVGLIHPGVVSLITDRNTSTVGNSTMPWRCCYVVVTCRLAV